METREGDNEATEEDIAERAEDIAERDEDIVDGWVDTGDDGIEAIIWFESLNIVVSRNSDREGACSFFD